MKDFEYPVYLVDKSEYDLAYSFAQKYKTNYADKCLIVFGSGIRGSEFGKFFEEFGITEFEYADNNCEKWGGVIGAHNILSLDELKGREKDSIIFISVESAYAIDDISTQLDSYGFKKGINLFWAKTTIYDNYIEEYQHPMKDHVVVVGDCRFMYISTNDTNMMSLQDIFRLKLDELGVKNKLLSMHAMNMQAQYYLINEQLKMGYVPKKMILTVTYETFNGTYHLLSSSQHYELIKRIFDISNSNDRGFEQYVEVTKQREKVPQAIFSMDTKGGITSDKKLRLYLKMHYMFTFQEENESFQYLLKILALAKQYNIKMILYIPSINYAVGEKYFGKQFITSYNQGLNKMKEAINRLGFDMLDLSYLLEKDGFCDEYDQNGLATYEGRVLIADTILEKL